MHINDRISRIREGVCYLIPLNDYMAWATMTGSIVYPWEYDILMEMDKQFCHETNLELEAKRERDRERREQEARSRGRR